MNDEMIAERMHASRVGEKRERGKPNRVWMDRVRKALNDGLTSEHNRADTKEFLNRM